MWTARRAMAERRTAVAACAVLVGVGCGCRSRPTVESAFKNEIGEATSGNGASWHPLGAEDLFRPPPWTRAYRVVEGDDEGGVLWRVASRGQADASEETGPGPAGGGARTDDASARWTIEFLLESEAPKESSAALARARTSASPSGPPSGATPMQRLELISDERGVAMETLVDLRNSTRVEFEPPVLLMAAQFAEPGERVTTGAARIFTLDERGHKKGGAQAAEVVARVEVSALAGAAEDHATGSGAMLGSAGNEPEAQEPEARQPEVHRNEGSQLAGRGPAWRVRTSLEMDLSSVVVRRESVQLVRRVGGVVREFQSRRVELGPFTISREERTLEAKN
ncbi:MAG: hypothetical protein SFZ23_15795 [Planctomycetota bacterium]|nr:hypothetical protein [Planctomycetota bacterium]